MDPNYYQEILDGIYFQQIFPNPKRLTSSRGSKKKYIVKDITKSKKFDLKQRIKKYIVKDGDLYYLKTSGKTIREAKVVRSAQEANALFVDFHASPTGAHCGTNKTINAISLRFYWPGMTTDIRKWVAECGQCQCARTIKTHKEYIPIEVSEPFELVGMDLVGKLTPTADGHQYMCVMVEYYTKWAEAYPLKTKSAEEVVACILDFFYKFGAPKRILTDQGREFVNKLNRGVCEKLQIDRSLCAPYHPQTNGLVEKMNGTITRTLNKLVEQKPRDWDRFLQPAMFGLRTKVQITTKHSPYYLMFGREARYPSEVPTSFEINDNVEDIIAQEVLSEGLKRQEDIYKLVTGNVKKVQEGIRKRKLEQGTAHADFMDSYGANPEAIVKCQDTTRAFLRNKKITISRWTCSTMTHPLQTDFTSCGAFVCKFAECLLEGKPLDFPTSDGMDLLRRTIASTLLSDTDDLNELCRVCGSEESSIPGTAPEDDWIECTEVGCGLWFHLMCVGRPPVEGEYTCPACRVDNKK